MYVEGTEREDSNRIMQRRRAILSRMLWLCCLVILGIYQTSTQARGTSRSRFIITILNGHSWRGTGRYRPKRIDALQLHGEPSPGAL